MHTCLHSSVLFAPSPQCWHSLCSLCQSASEAPASVFLPACDVRSMEPGRPSHRRSSSHPLHRYSTFSPSLSLSYKPCPLPFTCHPAPMRSKHPVTPQTVARKVPAYTVRTRYVHEDNAEARAASAPMPDPLKTITTAQLSVPASHSSLTTDKSACEVASDSRRTANQLPGCSFEAKSCGANQESEEQNLAELRGRDGEDGRTRLARRQPPDTDRELSLLAHGTQSVCKQTCVK
eukprot:6204220-Pleurochrysis_carterae.AAC.1